MADFDRLKIPYKFGKADPGIGPTVRKLLTKWAGDKYVTPDQLQHILDELLPQLGDQDRQNWLEVERYLNRNRSAGGGFSLYDAIVDPTFPTDTTRHRYINFTELLANESWLSDTTFYIGVVGRDTNVTESSNLSFPGPVAIRSVHLSDAGTALWDLNSGRSIWDFDGHHVTSDKPVHIIGMQVRNLGTALGALVAILGDGYVYAENCIFNGWESAQQYVLISSQPIAAVNCEFFQIAFTNVLIANDCIYHHHIGDWGMSSSRFIWSGGLWIMEGNDARFTFAGSTEVYIETDCSTASVVGGSSGSGVPNFVIANTGFTVLRLGNTGNLFDIEISDSAGDVNIEAWGARSITNIGNASHRMRHLVGSLTGLCDWTDEGTVTLAGIGSIILRGKGIRAEFQSYTNGIGGAAVIQLINADDSLITATLVSGGSGQPYTIDAASTNSILIITGANSATWTTPGANASASSIVRDELTL